MNNVPLDETLVEDEDDEVMDVDDNDNDNDGGAEDEDEGMTDFFSGLKSNEPEKTKSKRKKTRVAALVRQKIEAALESTGLTEKRARQCDETDFLKLLHALNSEGIHFA